MQSEPNDPNSSSWAPEHTFAEENENSGLNEMLAVRTQIKNAFYFTSDPQLDPLMHLLPGVLTNGFNKRIGGRVASEHFFTFLDDFIRSLLDQAGGVGAIDRANARELEEMIVGSENNNDLLGQAHLALQKQISAFARNRVVFPYNILCDFDSYGSQGYLMHTKELAIAKMVTSLVELEQEWKEREIRMVPFMQEQQLWQVQYIFLVHGSWDEHGLPSSVMVLVGELAHEDRNLLKRFLDPRNPHQKLYYLGPQKNLTSKEKFFEDMSIIESNFRERKSSVFLRIAKMRFWVSSTDSIFQGSILGMQYFHGEKGELALPLRGSKTTAQFFVDVITAKNERITEISGYWDNDMLGTLTIVLSSGARYRIGRRAVGEFFHTRFDVKDDFEMISFSGEVSSVEDIMHLKSLQVLFCSPAYFYAPSAHSTDIDPPLLDIDNSASVTIGGIPNATPEMGQSRNSWHSNASASRPPSSSSRITPTPTTYPNYDIASASKPSRSRREASSNTAPGSSLRTSSPSGALMGSASFVESKEMKLKSQDSQKYEDDPNMHSWLRELQAAVVDDRATAQTKYIFHVEYCTAERPTASLRGSAKQYLQVAVDLKQKTKLMLWEYNVSVLRNAKFERWGKDNNMITTPIKPRIGSCEIWMSWQHQGTPHTILLHSKLESRRWPSVDYICTTLVSLFPTQYHDVRFMVETEQGPLDGVQVSVKMMEGQDSLKILGGGGDDYGNGTNLAMTTDGDGLVSISLPAGTYEVHMSHSKNAALTFVYTLGSPQDGKYEPFKRILMTGRIEPDKIYFVLEWGALPEDLDLFAVTPHDKVFFANPKDNLTGGTCSLDCDVRDGFGPEIMCVNRMNSNAVQQFTQQGRCTLCHVYVYQYSDAGSIATSGAVLKVLLNSKELFKAKVPIRGVGQFWDAFSIDLADLTISPRNRIIPSEPSFDVVGPDGQVTPSCAMGRARFDVVKPGPLFVANSNFAPVRTSSAVLHEHKDHSGVR